ncbi:hypothetical protein [Paraburkholderia sp.]|uniref:hypothetical protein n=1 Tax=Paraburkholderia sp. TaxID=1926495 RepID=UPI003C7BD4C8
MNQLAPIDRDGPVAVAPGVIFSGTPSQVVNLPTYIKGGFGAIVVFAAYLYALTRWPVPWFVPVVALLAIAAGVVVAYLRTAYTEIIIDTARLTCRQGILSRRVQSLELFRIQDVTSWRVDLAGTIITVACIRPLRLGQARRNSPAKTSRFCSSMTPTSVSPCERRKSAGKRCEHEIAASELVVAFVGNDGLGTHFLVRTLR